MFSRGVADALLPREEEREEERGVVLPRGVLPP